MALGLSFTPNRLLVLHKLPLSFSTLFERLDSVVLKSRINETIPPFTVPSFVISARIDEMDICDQDPFSREKSFSTIIQCLVFYKHHQLQVFFRFTHRIAAIYH